MKKVCFLLFFALYTLANEKVVGVNWKDYTKTHEIRGTCGDNLEWTWDEETLIIDGTGEMTNFSEFYTPWYDIRDSIRSIVIRDGVTSIGNYAFQTFPILTEVSLPTSLNMS